MHVLLISRSFPHHRPGGLEWHGQDIAEGLIAAGHRVSILTTPLPRERALAPLTVNGRIVEIGRRPGSYDLAFFNDLRRRGPSIIRDLAPDVIHAQGFGGMAAHFFLRGGPPLVTTIHGTLWSETPLRGSARERGLPRLALLWRYKHRLAIAPLWRKFLREARHLVIDSRFTREELAREGGRLGCEPVVVPLGFDLARFPLEDRDAARRELGIAAEQVLLVSLGRLEPVKMPDRVLESFLTASNRDPRLRLILGGEGTMLPELRRRVTEANAHQRVNLPGRIDSERVAKLYAAADLFVNGDIGDPAFGLTNAEALCQGTPVFTTPAGAHREVVREPQDGRIAPIDRATWQQALEATTATLPEQEGHRTTRAQKARERFSREPMIEALVKVYQTAQKF